MVVVKTSALQSSPGLKHHVISMSCPIEMTISAVINNSIVTLLGQGLGNRGLGGVGEVKGKVERRLGEVDGRWAVP